MEWKRSTRLAAYGIIALVSFCLRPSRAFGQQTSQFAVGVAMVGPFPSESGSSYVAGPTLRFFTGGVIAPRVRLSADFIGVAFERPVLFPTPCPSTGCTHPGIYDGRFSGLIGVSASARINLDSRSRFYAIAGAGGYESFLLQNDFHVGLSGGAGMAIPFRSRMTAVVEADWHELLGGGNGIARFIPITVGLRF